MADDAGPKKIDPGKLKQAVKGMVGKAEELGWSLKQTPEERKKACETLEFVYVKLDCIRGPWKKKGVLQDKGAFVMTWGCKGIGFGELAFCIEKDGTVSCQTETMRGDFIQAAMAHWLKTNVKYDNR